MLRQLCNSSLNISRRHLRRTTPQAVRSLCSSSSSDRVTHFGFTDVPLSSKPSLVNEVFSSVASQYDLMNDLMSFRMHRIWKSLFVNDMHPTLDMNILDCAGGTGDITQRINERVMEMGGWKEGSGIVVCDVNEDMLKEGQKRFQGVPNVQFALGDAENLPFDDESFDIYCISFGMRNVSQPANALRDAYRVLKPGGRFMMLEFAKVNNPFFDQLYKAYSFNVIPKIGSAVAGDEASYRYLVESIDRFSSQDEFKAMMKTAGFSHCRVVDYTGGIVAAYSGFKHSK